MRRTFKKTVPRKPKPSGHPAFSFTANVVFYPILLAAALVFAQSLKLPVSYMVFLFVLILPLGVVVQLVLARIFLCASVRTEADTVEKNTPLAFSVLLSNDSLFPFPFVEAELLLPDGETAVRCGERRFALSLPPKNGCEIRRSARFSFRGEYDVGVKCLYVYDLFRVVRMRVKLERYETVFVMPRRLTLPPRPLSAESDLNTQTVIRQRGSDNTESSDIRSYEQGDSLKSIHWKLSSKSQDLLVREYSKNNGNSVYVFCDLEPHYRKAAASENADAKPSFVPLPECADTADELGADLVIEHCIASTLRELKAGNDVTLSWFRRDQGSLRAAAVRLATMQDFEQVFRRFAAAPLIERGNQPTELSSLIADATGSSLIFITAFLDAAAAAEYISIANAYRHLGAKALELVWCADRRFFVPDDEAEKQLDRWFSELRSAGFTVSERLI